MPILDVSSRVWQIRRVTSKSLLQKCSRFFSHSIVHEDLWISISEQIKVEQTTFQDCISYGRKAYDASKNKFVLIQIWQNQKRGKGKPTSIYEEHMLILAANCDISNISLDQWYLSNLLREHPEEMEHVVESSKSTTLKTIDSLTICGLINSLKTRESMKDKGKYTVLLRWQRRRPKSPMYCR